ncbi:MAG: hypothetical protein AUJ75_01270, partial [Candidatus Omnitrophica bacterium CG1_02_49_10]
MSARILPVDESNATEELKDVYEKIKSGFGGVPNVFKTIGHKPKALSAFFALTGVLFSDNSITPKIRELAVLMTSMVNQCHYCIFHHTAMG